MKYHMNARIHRSMKHNLSFYILSSILTGIVVYLIITVFAAILMMETDFNKVLNDGNVEDAQFTTLQPISDEEMKQLENKYQVQLEKIEYLDMKSKDTTIRVYQETEKIDRYQLLEGNDLSSENDILLNRDYVKANKLSLRENIQIDANEYNISGIAVKPDYLYPQRELTDFYVNKQTFGIGVISKDDFAKLEHTQAYYTVVYQHDNETAFRNEINESYSSLSYLSSNSNNRINMARDHMDQIRIIFGAMVPIFFLLVVGIVAVVLGRMIKKEQKQIGTMVSFGYRKREIINHYIRFAAIPGVAGSLFGILLSIVLLRPTLLLYTSDFELINYHTLLDVPALLIGTFTPIILNIITGSIIVSRLLRKNVVLLLTGNAKKEKQNHRQLFSKSKISFRYKYWVRTLIQNKSRTAITLVGMIAGSFMCLLSFMIIDSCDYMIKKGVDAAGNYEYQYYLNVLQTDEPMDGEQLLSMNFEVKGNRKGFSLIGLVENPKFLNLSTASGKKIDYGKYYMTSNAAALYGVSAGDKFTLQNPLTQKETTITVTDIVNDDVQCALYSSLDNVADIIGVPEGSYNVLMSEHELDLNQDIIYRMISKQDLRDQFEFTIDMMYEMIQLFIGFGVLLCIISVYITVNMLVQENGGNISMLKVLGYRTKEINRLVIHTNHILVPIAMILSYIACKFLCEMIFSKFIDLLNIYIHPEIKLTSVLICTGILIVSYALSITLLKRKVLRVHMVESLKDNRE